MVSYCQVEGINTFFVVEVSAAAINSYETDMLYNNFVEGIIQPEFRAINGDMFIYCKINGMKSLDDISDRGIMSMEQAVALMRSLCSAVMETGEYMLEPDNLLIESDKIFYSDAEKSFRYVYVPGQGTDVRMGIKNLVEKIIKRVDHRDTELVDFMYEIYDMVVSANYDMERMQKYVDEVSAREQEKCCSGNRKRNVESLAAAREQELLMDEVFGTDQSSAAALTIPTMEKNKYDRIFFILIGFTVAAFTGIAAVQFYIQGHAADVRFIMLALIVLSVELFVYVEMNRKLSAVEDERRGQEGVECSELRYVEEDENRRPKKQNVDALEHVSLADEIPGDTTVLGSEDDCTTLLTQHNLDGRESAQEQRLSVRLIEDGGIVATEFPVTPEGVVLGRDRRQADQVIEDISVSRRHIRIYEDAEKIYVEDLDSTNGTVINGIRLPAGRSWQLADRDVLCIGTRQYHIQILLI